MHIKHVKPNMSLRHLTLPFLAAFLLAGSCKTPTNGNDGDDPVTMPQEHIPWPSLADSPWPMYRHDPQGTGRSQYSGPETGELAFTFNDTFSFAASIAIGDTNRLYFTTSGNDGYLYAINSSREKLWTRPLDPSTQPNFSTPTLASNGDIYLSSTTLSQSKIYALAQDGSEQWSYGFTGYSYTNITLDLSGNLYFISTEAGKLVSLTPGGTLRWELSAHDRFFSDFSPTVFVPDGSILYVSGADSLYAVTTAGDIVWGYWTNHHNAWHHLVDNDGNVYFYNLGDSTITSLTPTGGVNWQTDLTALGLVRIAYWLAPTMDNDGNLYFAGDQIVSLNGIDGSLRWKLPLYATVTSSDLVSDAKSNVYFASASTVYCISPKGQILWQVEVPATQQLFANGPSIGSNGIGYFPVIKNFALQIIGIR